MDEADLARAMAAGELASPQQYGNSWFFDLRISGTGGAYREGLDEYVWRDPSIYLNQHFLDRCNGLPVIIEHPAGEMLDSKEYYNRNIGSIVYPYIRGEDVRGIARIIDQPAARYMQEHTESTSPAVVFTKASGNEKIEVGDGRHLLIEGTPKLIDHLAICDEGVWDKGGPPAGVDTAGVKEVSMPEVKEKESMEDDRKDARRDDDDHRMDAEAGEKLDKLLEGIKVLSDRMDSYERDRKDARKDEEMMSEEDRAKRDAEESEKKKEEEEREDKMRRDARGGRKDEDAETEARQAAELRKLAEEEAEAAKEEEKDADRKDAKKRDDEDEEEEKMPWDEGERKEGESDSSYARRMDALAKKHDSRYAKRDDESTAAYCDRMSKHSRRDRARKDAQTRLAKVDAIADSVNKLVNRMSGFEKRYQSDERPQEDEVLFADAQAQADPIYMAHGDHAPRAMRGEGLAAYRVRLLRPMQKHSDAWKDSDMRLFTADPKSFANIERVVYADAAASARKPTGLPPGTLREIQTKLPGGHVVTDFVGEPISWMQGFMGQSRCLTRLSGPRPR